MERLAAWPLLRGFASVSAALRAVAALVLVLVAGAAWYGLTITRQIIIANSEQQVARLDMVFAEQTGRAIEAVDLLVNGALEMVQHRLMYDGNLDDVPARMRQRIRGVRQLAALTVVDADGQVIVSSEASRDLAPANLVATLLQSYNQDPDAGLQITPPFRAPDGRWYSLLARPMTDAQGRITGLAAGTIALSYFEEFYRTVELNENGAIILHLRNGTMLARFPHRDDLIGINYGSLPPFRDVLSKEIAGTLQVDSPTDGHRRIVAIRSLRGFPMAVIVSVEQSRVLANWRHGAAAVTGLTTGLGCVIALLLWVLSRRSREAERLLAATRAARVEAEQANHRLLQQIAERERAEGALRQAQRLEAVGQLTGGVAHDFNNLLTVVLGNVDFLRRRIGAQDPAFAARLDAIRAAAKRGATLTSHLLSFARRQPLMPRPVDLNAMLRGMHDLLSSALGMNASIDFCLAEDLWPAMVDVSQIELVILNLVINARDAMPVGGVVEIETANLRRTQPAGPESPPPGDYVSVAVRDRGTGMTPEVLARVFEPFFTTKPPGAGSGLGLSQVFGTARQSGGEVRIESQPGKGTTVTVELPRAARAAEAPSRPVAARRINRSTATILLVDDEEPVRAVTAAMLRELGYDVLQAEGGASALAMLEQAQRIDILLTDLAMPGMSGAQLAAEALLRRPGIRVIFITGHGDKLRLSHPMICKPFDPAGLHTAIETALEAARQPAA